MFTGIIEQRGKVSEVRDGGSLLVVSAPTVADVAVGGSVSVNGVCLTVVETNDEGARFDVVPETLARTTLGGLVRGDEVNLELPMPANGRFEGHIVQGHVDGTGIVAGLTQGDQGVILSIEAPPDLMSAIVEKGSITVDGVSLTVAAVTSSRFEVALVPHTLEVTTLGARRPGDRVNLEVDIIAKYVARILGAVR
jgi:riboflavin synthase